MICASCSAETPEAPCAACGADPALDGRYRLEHPLGHGGTGITWAAVRIEDAQRVAIKAVPVPPRPAAKEHQLLGREVEVLGQLDHPAIPQLLDSFVVRAPGGVRIQHVVMAFIEGQTLGAEIRERRLSEGEVLQILDELAGILAYLHGLSPPVVHRDLKPDNVIRRPDGGLSLIDFGAVKDALSDPLVGGSTFVGSFGYMAPEQLHGDADPRSDLYALGALAVRLLTRIEPRELIEGQRLAWRSRCQVSDEAAALIDTLLASDPSQRPPSAEAVRTWIAGIGQPAAPRDRSARPRPPRARDTPLGPEPPGRPRSPRTGVLTALLAALLTGGSATVGLLALGALGLLGLWWFDPFGTPITAFELDGLRLGATRAELQERFPGPLEDTYHPDRFRVRLLVQELPARCELWFPEENGGRLCELDCTLGDDTNAFGRQLRSSLRHYQGGPWASPVGWTWSDRGGEIRIFVNRDLDVITHACTEIAEQRGEREEREAEEAERRRTAEEIRKIRESLGQ